MNVTDTLSVKVYDPTFTELSIVVVERTQKIPKFEQDELALIELRTSRTWVHIRQCNQYLKPRALLKGVLIWKVQVIPEQREFAQCETRYSVVFRQVYFITITSYSVTYHTLHLLIHIFRFDESGVARAKKTSWYNALYPSYKSRSEDFKKTFSSLPSNERLIVGKNFISIYRCWKWSLPDEPHM